MRLNKFIAQATGMGRRAADAVVADQRVKVNEHLGQIGEQIEASDQITLDGKRLTLAANHLIMLNKPVGYVCSRRGQGSQTIYDLLPPELRQLKPVGRLDKDSSGLLLLTNDGLLAHELTHPSFNKTKVYEVELDKTLTIEDRVRLESGVKLDDGLSRIRIIGHAKEWQVSLSEGRKRQVRRTFGVLGYKVLKLHRTAFGPYRMANLKPGQYRPT